MRSGSPVRGSVSANSIGASRAEATQVSSNSSRNSIAGSGSRLPAASMPLRTRETKPPLRLAAFRCLSDCAFAMVTSSSGQEAAGPDRNQRRTTRFHHM